MNGEERRKQILQILCNSKTPVSGAQLAEQMKVSRQVIVQDMALLRANGNNIFSTNRGYMIQQKNLPKRVFKVFHSNEEVTEELNLVVDLGGIVEDVFVYHKVYGVVHAPMNIRSRRDVQLFIKQIQSGKSSLLMNVTSGYHYHTISADSEETLNLIFEALQKRGFLAALQDYEPVDFWKEG
ncbi:MAG: transcription repressor NadR [Lachnospiraceae bacterium]